MNKHFTIDKTWSLFLDRDGVINKETHGTYVLQRNEFIFLPGAKDALKLVADLFGTIVITTNQRGVAKGLMSLADLQGVHEFMLKEIVDAGGRIDKIYFSTALNDDDINRKPQKGMALQALADYEHIDFTKSIMVGNKLSDMQFGRNCGMHTVFIASTNPEILFPHELIDARFDSLKEFSDSLIKV